MPKKMTDTEVRALCEAAGEDLTEYPRDAWEEGARDIAASLRDCGEVPKRYSIDLLADWVFTGASR